MGCEPSGKAYNFLELKEDRIPHNPLINSGNIMSCALIFKGERADRRFEKYCDVLSWLIGKKKVGFNNECCLAETSYTDKNYCLAYMM